VLAAFLEAAVANTQFLWDVSTNAGRLNLIFCYQITAALIADIPLGALLLVVFLSDFGTISE
jgi:hypothetical protein